MRARTIVSAGPRDDESARLLDLAPSWELSLRAENKSPGTVRLYLNTLTSYARFVAERGLPDRVAAVQREHIEQYLSDVLEHQTPGTAHTRYGTLRQFWRWCVEEGECDHNPMERIKQPKLPETLPPMPTQEQLKKALKLLAGRDFASRRAAALIYLMADTGIRRMEATQLRLDDIDWRDRRLTIRRGKGGRERRCRLGKRTLRALDAYIRARARQRHADSPMLWIGQTPALSHGSLYEILRSVGRECGFTLRPHMLRHYFADAWLAVGGSEGDLMELGGWRSTEIMRRYGRSNRIRRATEAHDLHSPGDRL